MEIVQTCTSTRWWCMSMFGARFAVFVRRARVLPGPCHATRNLSFLRFHRRVGVNIPQDGNRSNMYGHVAVVPGHVWCTVYSVCAPGARVAQPMLCNSFHALLVFQLKKKFYNNSFITQIIFILLHWLHVLFFFYFF